MTLFDYLRKNMDDFSKKEIVDINGNEVHKGCLQDISFDIPIHEMEIVSNDEKRIIVSRNELN